jgi:hypothetical protein
LNGTLPENFIHVGECESLSGGFQRVNMQYSTTRISARVVQAATPLRFAARPSSGASRHLLPRFARAKGDEWREFAKRRLRVQKRKIADMNISTLREIIEAMGGKLELVAPLRGRGGGRLSLLSANIVAYRSDYGV